MQNQIKSPIQLQEILAKLITNTRYTLKALENPAKFIRQLGLEVSLAEQLETFFSKSGYEFLISSCILKKKRLTTLLMNLTLVKQLYTTFELEDIWERYLSRIDFNREIAINPLIESVNFCEYLLEYEEQSEIGIAATWYELMKNRVVIGYRQYQKLCIDRLTLEQCQGKDATSCLYLHPCVGIAKFNINFSILIDSIKKFDINKLENEICHVKENILFYKNWHTEQFNAVKISDEMVKILKNVTESTSILDLRKRLQNECEMNREKFDESIKLLYQFGIVTLTDLKS